MPGGCGCAQPTAASAVRITGLYRYHRDMTMDSTQAVASRAGLAPAAALFRSLGDPARLAIVRRLAAGPARVADLTGELGLAQSTVSGHLACLRDCGLAASRAQGRASLWFLTQPALPALPALLAAAEDLLRQTGNAVALCPAYGQGR
jgi:ArsR family transcriptional regulator, cadmium/lead-responsive transcriptional repressor